MDTSAAEIAGKQRYLHLLQKVRANRPLSAAELKELKKYEEMSTQTAEKKIDKSKIRRRGTGGRFAALTDDAQLTALAAELKSVAALDSQFEEHFELEKYPRVKKALEAAVGQRVEEIIRQRLAGPGVKDYRKITLQQLTEITGKTRRTIYDWLKKGLPRNADGTFDLGSFINWFEKYTIEKLPANVVEAINPLQAKKAERLDIDLARQRNQLLNRGEVMAGQIARHQTLINSLSHKAEELALLANGQPQAKIAELLNGFFDEVLKQQCQVPEVLQLPEEKTKQFAELLNGLRPEGE